MDVVKDQELRLVRGGLLGSYSSIQSVVALLVALFSLVGVSLSLSIPDQEKVIRLFGEEGFLSLGRIILSLPDKDSSVWLILVLCPLFFLVRFGLFRSNGKRRLTNWIIPFGIGVCSVVGKGLSQFGDLGPLVDGATQCIKSVWAICGYSVLSMSAIAMFDYVLDSSCADRDRRAACSKHRWKTIDLLVGLMNRHPVGLPFFVIIVAWLPFLIGTYPGILMGDTGAQIAQWFNQPNWISDYLILDNPDVLLNSHHPVLHTAIVGLCVSVGHLLSGSYEIGYFIYTLLQYLIVAATLAYSISLLGKIGILTKGRFIVLGFCILVPYFPQYAVLGTKDTLFACCVLLLFLSIYMLVKCPEKMKFIDKIISLASTVGFVFLRNGSIVLLAVIFAVLLVYFLSKNGRIVRTISCIFCTVLALYCLVSYVLFPFFDITPGSKREVLSLPVQQVARCIEEHGSELSFQDVESIDGVFDFEVLAEDYDPSTADPVKASFREESSNEDLGRFIRTWFSLVARYPSTCLEATLLNYYGIFSVSNIDNVMYDPASSARQMNSKSLEGFDFTVSENQVVRFFADVVTAYQEFWQRVPIFSILTSAAFYFWMLLLAFRRVVSRKDSGAISAAFLILVLLVAFIAPCNATLYLRYIVPIIFCFPFFSALLFSSRGSSRQAVLRLGQLPEGGF